tara:strand:- start:23261 stop:24655 length:1395 start_codon:yes stop_codon:yes gene_type:complete
MLTFQQHHQNQEAINKFGFHCIDLLNAHVVENENRETPNLCKLFFHELVCFFTSTYISQITNQNDSEKAELPFANNTFIREPKMHFLKDKSRNFPSRVLLLLFQLNFWSKKKIWISPTLRREEIKVLLKYAFKFKIRFSIKNQLTLKEFEVEEFNQLIKEINKQLNLSLTQDHLDCFFTYCNQFFNTSERTVDKKGILFTGTTTKIESRINAANFLKQNQKVYSFGHGYASARLFKEPVFNYGEKWYCSTFIDYGQFKKEKSKNSPKVINRTSERIQTLRNTGTHELIKENFLYVPTSLSSYKTYAPYRNFYDAYYIAWQKKLLDYLSKANMNFKLKAHPKTILDYDFLSEGLIEKKGLDQCFNDYDGFIFDYLSTALTETLATKNKVFFFDIGNRKIAKKALLKIKYDAYYIKINFDQDINQQIAQNFGKIKSRRFSYTDTYSTHKHSTNKVINDILKDYSME